MIGGGLIARMGVGEAIPVVGKDLLEDVPVPRGCCKHQGAPSWGVEMVVVQRLYHTSPAQSTPSAVCMGHPQSPTAPDTLRINWLRVLRRPDAACLGAGNRPQHQSRAVRGEKCV